MILEAGKCTEGMMGSMPIQSTVKNVKSLKVIIKDNQTAANDRPEHS